MVPPSSTSPDAGSAGSSTSWLRTGALAFVMFLVATVAPGISSTAPAANAAPVVSGALCAFTPQSITGSTWDQASGNPGGSLPATDAGASKLGAATFQFRYTMGATNAAAAAGPWSNWISVTSSAGGDYCVSGLDGFRPTTGGILGSYVQFDSDPQVLGATTWHPASLPGHGGAVQAQIDPTTLGSTFGTVDPATNSVYNYHVQFMRQPSQTTPLGAATQQEDCRLRIGGINYDNTNCASIRGTVGVERVLDRQTHDTNDSVVAGATVCAEPQGSSIVRCDVTDASGEYEINFFGSDRWVHDGSSLSFHMANDPFTMWVVPPSGYRTYISRPFAQGVVYRGATGALMGTYLAPGTITNTGHRLTNYGGPVGNSWTFALVNSNEETLTVPPAACPAPGNIGVTVGNLVGGATYQLRVGAALYPVPGAGTVTIPTPTSAVQIELLRTQGSVEAVPVSANYTPLVCPTLAEQNDPGYSPSSTTPGVEVSVPQTQDTTMPPGTIATIDPATVPLGWIVSVDPNTHVVKATPPGNAAPGATANIGVIFTYTDGSVDTTTATVTVNAAPTPTVTTTVTSTAVTTQVTTAVVTTTTTAAPVTTTETTTATSLVPTTTTAAPVTTTETAAPVTTTETAAPVTTTETAAPVTTTETTTAAPVTTTETTTAAPVTTTETTTAAPVTTTATSITTVIPDPETSTVVSVTTSTVMSTVTATTTATETATTTATTATTVTELVPTTTTAVTTATVTESAVTQILQPTTFTASPTTTYTTSIVFPSTTVDITVPPVTAPTTTTVLVTNVDSGTTNVTAAPVVIVPPGGNGTGSLSGGSIGTIVEGSLGDDGSSGGSLETILATIFGSLGLPVGSLTGSLGESGSVGSLEGSLGPDAAGSIEGSLGSDGESGSLEGSLGESGSVGSLEGSLGPDAAGSIEGSLGSDGESGSFAGSVEQGSVQGSLAAGSLGSILESLGSSGESGPLGSLEEALGSGGESGPLGSLEGSLGPDGAGSIEEALGSLGGAGSLAPILVGSAGGVSTGSLALGSLGLTALSVGGVIHAINTGLIPLPPGIQLPTIVLPPLPQIDGLLPGSLGIAGAGVGATTTSAPPPAPGPVQPNGGG